MSGAGLKPNTVIYHHFLKAFLPVLKAVSLVVNTQPNQWHVKRIARVSCRLSWLARGVERSATYAAGFGLCSARNVLCSARIGLCSARNGLCLARNTLCSDVIDMCYTRIVLCSDSDALCLACNVLCLAAVALL